MVLYGPAGIGKLSVVQALYRSLIDPQYGLHHALEGGVEDLHRFLMAALANPRNPHTGQPRFYIVKGLPATAHLPKTKSDLHQAFADYARVLALPGPKPYVVFIFTVHDTHSTNSEIRRAYPSSLLDHRCVHLFKAPLLTERNLNARLRTVSAAEGVSVSADVLDRIVLSTNGDIRHALLQLQWETLGTKRHQPLLGPAAKPKRSKKVVDATSSSTALLFSLDEASAGSRSKRERDDSEPERREAPPPEARDKYIDASHSTARLLGGKYNPEDVLRCLPVSPSRAMEYVCSSLFKFFDETQLDELAAAASAVSAFDSSPVTQFGFSGSEEPSRVAFHVFGATYRQVHPRVANRGFDALLPLPPVSFDFLTPATEAVLQALPPAPGSDKVAREGAAWRPFEERMARVTMGLRCSLCKITSSLSCTEGVLDTLSFLSSTAFDGEALLPPSRPATVTSKPTTFPARHKPTVTRFVAKVQNVPRLFVPVDTQTVLFLKAQKARTWRKRPPLLNKEFANKAMTSVVPTRRTGADTDAIIDSE